MAPFLMAIDLKDWSSVLIVIGLITIVLMIGLRKRRSTQPFADAGFGSVARATSREQEIRDSLDEIFVRLQDYSRVTLAQLDTKARLLSQLLREADERIAALRQTMQLEPETSPPPSSLRQDPLHQKVYQLADDGHPVEEVAKETGLQRGEIELILGLRQLPPNSGADSRKEA